MNVQLKQLAEQKQAAIDRLNQAKSLISRFHVEADKLATEIDRLEKRQAAIQQEQDSLIAESQNGHSPMLGMKMREAKSSLRSVTERIEQLAKKIVERQQRCSEQLGGVISADKHESAATEARLAFWREGFRLMAEEFRSRHKGELTDMAVTYQAAGFPTYERDFATAVLIVGQSNRRQDDIENLETEAARLERWLIH